MAPEGALQIMQALQAKPCPFQPLSLLAARPPTASPAPPTLLANGDPVPDRRGRAQLEQQLAQHFHYQLARELGQLEAAQGNPYRQRRRAV